LANADIKAPKVSAPASTPAMKAVPAKEFDIPL
jgi:hypothetical protein